MKFRMIYPFHKTVYNCRQATLLSIKRAEGQLSLVESIKLSYHLLFCDPCKNFIFHWNVLSRKGRETSGRYLNQLPFTLSEESRKRIQEQVDIQKT